MSWVDEIWKLRRELVALLDQRFNLLFGWTETAIGGQVAGADTTETSDDDLQGGKKQQRPVTRIEPWGFRGVPPKGIRRFWVSWGKQGSKTVSLGFEVSQGYGPQDMTPGESAQYCAVQGVVIRQDKDGNIVLHCAPGKLVTVDDGSGAVPLVLKSDFDGHTHGPGSYLDGGSNHLTGSSGGAGAAVGTTVLKGK